MVAVGFQRVECLTLESSSAARLDVPGYVALGPRRMVRLKSMSGIGGISDHRVELVDQFVRQLGVAHPLTVQPEPPCRIEPV